MKRNLLFVIALFLISVATQAQHYWTQQNTHMTGTASGVAIGVDQVSIVNSNIVWVNGFNGSGAGKFIKAMSRTNDKGITWVPGSYTGFGTYVQAAVLCGVSYYKAFCVAYDTAAGAASFWKTIDGGTSWSLVTGVLNTGTTTFADGVKFWSNGKGFCYGDPVNKHFDIYTTSDSGATWTHADTANIPISSNTSEYGYNGFDCATIVPGGIAWFLTNTGRVLKTSDYGVHWTATAVAPFTAIANGIISASSANYAIIGAYPLSTSTTESWKYTTNGGTTWDTLAPTGSFYQYQLCYVPGTTNMFVASSPFSTSIMGVGYSTDGGLTWTDYTDSILQPAGSNIQGLGIGFYNTSLGWMGNYDQSMAINSILRFDSTLNEGIVIYPIDGNNVNIYPNPSNGYVNFNINGETKEDITIKVMDIAGKEIFERTLNVSGTSSTSYNFSDLSKGIYLVNISTANNRLTKKLIIN